MFSSEFAAREKRQEEGGAKREWIRRRSQAGGVHSSCGAGTGPFSVRLYACLLLLRIDVHNGLVPERVPGSFESPEDAVAPDPLRHIRRHGAGRLA